MVVLLVFRCAPTGRASLDSLYLALMGMQTAAVQPSVNGDNGQLILQFLLLVLLLVVMQQGLSER